MNTLAEKMIKKPPRWGSEDTDLLRQLMDRGEVGVEDKPADIVLKFPNFGKFPTNVFRTHLSLLKRNTCERRFFK